MAHKEDMYIVIIEDKELVVYKKTNQSEQLLLLSTFVLRTSDRS